MLISPDSMEIKIFMNGQVSPLLPAWIGKFSRLFLQ